MNALTNQLHALKQLFLEHDDAGSAERLSLLIEQSAEPQLAVAFCGHFSAGKSTLINALCGARLLPSSPIPTSANIVTIKNGEPGVSVLRHKGRDDAAVGARVELPLEKLEEICKDGADIESVEIRYPVSLLGDDMMLMDTPGIDSTDELHLQATLSSLYQSDVVFYVMDYNHVQSEINFSFAKQLKEWGKPLYLIVNQIDKHKERELPFAEYKKSAEKAFADWDIIPDGMLYLSLREPAHPQNEWHKLLWILRRLREKKADLRLKAIVSSARQLAERHLEAAAAGNEPYRRELSEAADTADRAALEDQRRLLEAQKEDLIGLQQKAIEECKTELLRIIENANLIPAGIRELAANVLQAHAPGFKVGWLGSKAKTEKETEARTALFASRFQEQIDAELIRHVADLLKQKAESLGISYQELEAEAGRPEFSVTPDWPEKMIKPGAGFTNEYAMNFARDMAEEVKRTVRRTALDVIESLSQRVSQKTAFEAGRLTEELRIVSERLQALKELQMLETREEQYRQKLDELLKEAETAQLSDLPRPDQAPEADVELPAIPLAEADGKITAEENVEETGKVREADWTRSEYAESGARAVLGIREACALLAGLPAMSAMTRSLSERAQRLENRTFTVALFGAFSAGKSSFANALIGESVLPVSPNPTTASICKLLAPAGEWEHGTAKIKMKSYEQISEDIRFSLSALGIEPPKDSGTFDWISSIHPSQISAKGKPHYSFLQAVLNGYKTAETMWGRQWKADLETFREFVADEAKSCSVDWIELHWDCPVTSQGLVMVDTPGADSIHARHTGVAFNYMKSADAIIFVTYYNHAFSQADQQFLAQLGRVKDQFELDKMFFIVNAADLAASGEELRQVVDHVKDNLTAHGIRNPRIYPLSSMMALEGKSSQNEASVDQSLLPRFERDFLRFRHRELTGLAVQAAGLEIDRAATMLKERLEAAGHDQEEKRKRQLELEDAQLRVDATIEERQADQDEREIEEEIRTLFHYVNQRIQYRFGEFYNFAFHPSVLNGSSSTHKMQLRSAWNELYRLLSYELSQELLATALRIETRMDKALRRWYDNLAEHIRQTLPAFEPDRLEPLRFSTADVEDAIYAEIDEKMLGRYFKNPKAFFEGTGKQELRAALESEAMSAVRNQSDLHEARFSQHYRLQMEESIGTLKARMAEIVREHTEGLLSVYRSVQETGKWKTAYERLIQIKDEITL